MTGAAAALVTALFRLEIGALKPGIKQCTLDVSGLGSLGFEL